MPFEIAIDPKWFIAVALSSMVFGLLSPLVVSRKMLFLAGSLPHSALLSVLLAIILNRVLGVPSELGSLLASVALVYFLSLMISRGIKVDVATAIFLSLTLSFTSFSLYYILTSFPIRESIWSYFVGDPLLVTWEDLSYASMVSSLTLALLLPSMRKQVLIGADRDFARISGVRVELYDGIAVITLAIASVGLLKITGFVLEHILILIPGVTAASIARNLKSFLTYAFILSLLGGLGGLMLSLLTGLAPSGCVGLILLSFYLASLMGRCSR